MAYADEFSSVRIGDPFSVTFLKLHLGKIVFAAHPSQIIKGTLCLYLFHYPTFLNLIIYT